MFKSASVNTASPKSANSSLFQNDKSEDAFVQPKLTVGKPNDRYEVEADRVADQVVAKSSENSSQNSSFFSPAPLVQHQVEESDKEVQQSAVAESITPIALRRQDEETSVDHTNETVQSKSESQNSFINSSPDNNTANTDIQKQEEEVQEKEEELPEVQQKGKILQRKEIGVPTVTTNIESRIQRASQNGKSMSKPVKGSMESGFGADFSGVKIHTDSESASLNKQMSSRAFTYKNNVFFGENQYRPETKDGQHLIAHELTHVVQQGHADKGESTTVTETVQPKVQRLGISDALDYFADKAYLIPGFRMFTIILGVNPINMSSVDRGAANIMRAIVEFLPGGNLITRVLDKYNVFTEAAEVMKSTLDTLSITGQSIKDAIDEFLDSLGWSDIFDLGDVWRRAKRIFTTPINQIIELGKSVVSTIYDIVKRAILTPLAVLAEGTDGYDLLKALIGKDPITGEAYPPTAENLIGGFMKFIGQEEIWTNIQQGNAIGQAWAWFQGAMAGLKSIMLSIPSTIMDTIQSLTWEDIIILPNAFIKVGRAFAGIAGSFMSWGLSTVIDLLKILFSVVAPGVLVYIEKAQGAFNQILENPVGFIGNLVNAAKLGFNKFAQNIGEHLKNSLLDWLLGSLAGAGIYIPQGLNFQEIIKFVASVLGLTWENLRKKLVEHLGEPAVKALETGFELIKILVTEGPAAAWEKIMEHISNLQQMIISEISEFVIVKVVQKAVTKIVSMLNPAGAVIQAIITIYDTITFLIEKLSKIGKVAAAIIDSLSAIANGVITKAANKVENTLANMLTLAINFLAKFTGLDKISEKIIEIVNKIREPIDTAMDKVIIWIVSKGKAFLKKVAQTGVPEDPEERLKIGMEKAVGAVNKLSESNIGVKIINPILAGIKVRYGFQVLTAVPDGEFWSIEGQVNPKGKKKTNKKVGGNKLGPDDAEIISEVSKIKLASQFNGKTFKMAVLKSYIEGNYDIKSTAIKSRIARMKGLGLLFVSESDKAGASDSNKDVSFDESLLSPREIRPVTNRNKYGYRNPTKTSAKGIQIMVKGLIKEAKYGYSAGKESDINYLQNAARFKDSKNNLIIKWDEAILGHDTVGASVHWNKGGGSTPAGPGHTQTKDQNFEWNQNVANYHGPEEKYKSKATGAGTENYETPGPPNHPDSHPMWWNPSDPNYQG